MNALQVRLGFNFSAGLFDYLLNFKWATRPLWLLPVGALYFALYYVLFRFVIVRFDLKTAGRESCEMPLEAAATEADAKAAAWIAALRGSDSRSVDACTTRLRLLVASQSAVNADALRRLGARGLVRPHAERDGYRTNGARSLARRCNAGGRRARWRSKYPQPDSRRKPAARGGPRSRASRSCGPCGARATRCGVAAS